MAEEEFTRMLEAMPKIAEAVKGLPTDLQQSAFDRLMGALTGTAVAAQHVPSADDDAAQDESAASAQGRPSRGRGKPRTSGAPRKKAKPKQIVATRDINFWPTGKTSFPDLVAQKLPATNFEKNLLIVWWFEENSEVAAVGVGEVLAGYKAASWRAPADPENSLQVTASSKHWLDTSDMKAIKTTHGGRNYVEHDMPATQKVTAKKMVKKATKKTGTKAAP